MLVSKYYEKFKYKYLIKHKIKMNYFLHLILISLQFSKNPEGMNKCISIEAGSIFFFFFFGSVVFKDDFFFILVKTVL